MAPARPASRVREFAHFDEEIAVLTMALNEFDVNPESREHIEQSIGGVAGTAAMCDPRDIGLVKSDQFRNAGLRTAVTFDDVIDHAH